MNPSMVVIALIFGVLLAQPAARMAWRRGWRVSALAAVTAFVVVTYVGGIILTVPFGAVVTGLFYAFALLKEHERRWTSTVHLMLGILITFWLTMQICLLPIRIQRGDSEWRIASNVAGIMIALSLLAAFVESARNDQLSRARSINLSGAPRKPDGIEL